MPLEIQCPQCRASLQVPDEAAGEQAKCPHCGEIFDVAVPVDTGLPAPPPPPTPPSASTSDPFAETTPPSDYGQPQEVGPGPGAAPGPAPVPGPSAGPPPGPSPDPANPYAAPTADAQDWGAGPSAQQVQLGQLDAGMALQIGFDLLRTNLPTLLAANGIVILVSFVISVLGGGIDELGNPALSAVFQLVATAIQWFLGIGLALINLRVARGQPADVGLLFSGGPWFLRVALATIVFMVMVGIGFILFIIPGIYLTLRFWPYQSFIIDRDCGVMESLTLAGQFTEGNKMQALVLMFLSIAIAIVGLLACGVGLFIAIPLLSITWIVAYLMITRQAIQRPTR